MSRAIPVGNGRANHPNLGDSPDFRLGPNGLSRFASGGGIVAVPPLARSAQTGQAGLSAGSTQYPKVGWVGLSTAAEQPRPRITSSE